MGTKEIAPADVNVGDRIPQRNSCGGITCWETVIAAPRTRDGRTYTIETRQSPNHVPGTYVAFPGDTVEIEAPS